MVIALKGDCEEKQKEENERVEIEVARKIWRAFEEESIRENFKDLVIYFKKVLSGYDCNICCDITLWKEDLGIVFIEVKAWDKDYLPIGWEKLKREENKTPISQLLKYINCILNTGIKPVSGVLAFPNLSVREIKLLPERYRAILEQNKDKILFKEDFENNEILRKKILKDVSNFYNNIPAEVVKKNMKKFKELFFPELEIPWKGNILDYIQEEFSYHLTKPPKRINSNLRDCNVISGCSGTGKSVVVISATVRCALEWYLRKEKDKKVYVLVFNKSFLKKIKEDIDYVIKKRKLPEELKNYINVSTLHSLAVQILKRYGVYFDEKKDKDAIRKLLDLMEENKIKIPDDFKPDILLIDEAQDIRRKWFKFIHSLLKPETIIGFAIDKVQRIYEDTDWTWKEVGFNAVGRSRVLKKIYRNASNISLLGFEFLKKDKEYYRELSKIEGSWVNENLEVLKKDKGIIEILHTESYKDLYKVVELLEELVEKHNPKDIMVLEFFSDKANKLKELIKEHGNLKDCVKDLTITTFYSSKGLEKKVVVIHDFDKLFHKVSTKKEERRRRSLGFVAITRAEDELYFIGNSKEKALKEIKEIVENLTT